MIISAPFQDRNPRLVMIGLIVSLGLCALLADLWRVQVMNAEHYGGREAAQSLRRVRVPSSRGKIVDRNGEELANNRPSFDIAIYLDQLGPISKTQSVVSVAEAKLAALGRALNRSVPLSTNDVRGHYEKRRPLPLPIWRNLGPDVVAAFEERASDLPGLSGFDLIVTPVRQYPHGSLAAHVLGYVGKSYQGDEQDVERFYYYQPDSVGQQGVERACDKFLRGAPGGYTIRVNPAGRKVGDVGRKTAEVGDCVMLTLDNGIQELVEQALANAQLSAGKEVRGAAVAIDPRSGAILAMASLPAFDPNLFNPGVPADTVNAILGDHQRSPMVNRATRGVYAPGSTFKPITLLAGLEAGKITPGDTVYCEGSLKIGTQTLRCHGTHHLVDAMDAVRVSCDVWFYQRGRATGVDAIAKMAGELGLGVPTGFDLGDRTGLVPTPDWKRMARHEGWWEGDTAQLAIGQSFLQVTPLQMANVAATLGNGGTRWQPFLVRRIENADGTVESETRPEIRNRLTASPEHISFVRRAMLGAIQDPGGTGHLAKVPGVSVAGKTGTAEYDVIENGVKHRKNHTWFIGFAPYENPQVALAVLIEDGASGGGTAAPVAARILAGIFHQKMEAVASGGGYLD